MNKRKKWNQGHFVLLPDSQTDSKAWKKLSTNAVWVYIEFMKKYKGKNSSTVDNLSLTYKEVKYKMSSATFWRAKDELLDLGFLKIVRPGGLMHRCTIYGLSEKWKFITDTNTKIISNTNIK